MMLEGKALSGLDGVVTFEAKQSGTEPCAGLALNSADRLRPNCSNKTNPSSMPISLPRFTPLQLVHGTTQATHEPQGPEGGPLLLACFQKSG